MAYRPKSAGATRRARRPLQEVRHSTTRQYESWSTAVRVLSRRSWLVARCVCVGDCEAVSTSAPGVDGRGGWRASDTVDVAWLLHRPRWRGIRSGVAGTTLRSEKGEGCRGSCRSLREVGGGTTTAPPRVPAVEEAGLRAAGSVPVVARVSASDLRLVGAIAFTGGGVTTAVCPSTVRTDLRSEASRDLRSRASKRRADCVAESAIIVGFSARG